MGAIENSIKALREIRQEGLLGLQQEQVLDALVRKGPMTGRELNAHLDSLSAHKRLSELKRLGVIEKVEDRRDRITGRTAAAYAPTGRLPVEPEPEEPPAPEAITDDAASTYSRTIKRMAYEQNGVIMVSESFVEWLAKEAGLEYSFDEEALVACVKRR